LTYEKNYKNGKLHGTVIEYVPPKSRRTHGKFKRYVPDGVKLFEKNYRNGKLNGISKTYNTDGTLQSESFYRDDQLIFTKQYDKKGKLVSETRY